MVGAVYTITYVKVCLDLFLLQVVEGGTNTFGFLLKDFFALFPCTIVVVTYCNH